jgi:hypothetical protein
MATSHPLFNCYYWYKYRDRLLRRYFRRRPPRPRRYTTRLLLLLLLRGLLTILLFGTLCVQLVLQSRFPPPPEHELFLRNNNARLPPVDPVEDAFQWQHHHHPEIVDNPMFPPPPLISAEEERYSCNDLFGTHQIVKRGHCLYHKVLNWTSCNIGRIRIDTTRIEGSLGGEPIHQVWQRPESEEKLTFHEGSLVLLRSSSSSSSSSSSKQQQQSKEDIIPMDFQRSIDAKLGGFLASAIVQNVVTPSNINHKNDNETTTTTEASSSNAMTTTTTTTTTLLVRRGNYANPCMALLTMYNVYIVLTYHFNDDVSTSTTLSNIIWLDGHAQGDLDPVWTRLFDTTPIHIRQLPQQRQSSIINNNDYNYDIDNAIVVNTMSAIGDEGYGRYDWNSTNNNNCQDDDSSTLVAFRDFVLERYGISRRRRPNTNNTDVVQQTTTTSKEKKILTLLVRKDYTAHPRSNGRTDRTLANVTADVEYLRSIYGDDTYTIQVVSFEGLPFVDQLLAVTQTDVFVSVHGAGNVHVLFLPDDATFVEYIPKGFERRRRFRYLAACLPHITYKAKVAWREQRKFTDGKISVRLRPESKRERAQDIW